VAPRVCIDASLAIKLLVQEPYSDQVVMFPDTGNTFGTVYHVS